MARRRIYSVNLFLNEATIAIHMAGRRDVLYHAIYADTDVHILGRAASATGNKLALTFHEPPGGLEFLSISKELLRDVSAVILVCEAQRSYFESMVPSDRIYVIPHGIDTSFFRRASALSKDPVCITVGNHYRDFVTLERTMEYVWSKRPDVRLIAIGTGRPPNSHITINDPRVEYLQDVDDHALLAAYQQARVALLSLKAATASNALLEAMACGLPTITTNCGGIPEYVGKDGGILISPNDPRRFAAAILDLIPADSVAEAIGANARKRACQFDYTVVADQMKKVYETVLAA
jgi:glycosyltransferase involved in cell wall biosynthesis